MGEAEGPPSAGAAPGRQVSGSPSSTRSRTPREMLQGLMGASEMPRVLAVPAMVGLIFFEVCGGPYGIEPVVRKAGDPLLALLGLTVLPLLWSAPIALMTAEMCSAFPEVGGKIYFVNELFGPYVGWLHGAFNAVSNVFDVATLPAMALSYIQQLGFPFADEYAPHISCLMILTACLLNIRGIEFVGAASCAFTVLVCSPFVVLALCGARGLPGLAGQRFVTHTLSPLKFLSCLLWNMSGYDDAGSTAAEIVNPWKVYPISLAIAMSIVTCCYVVPVMVGLTVLPATDEWHDGSFVLISTRVGGSTLGASVAFFGALSSFGQLNALLCSSVREIVCMAKLPRQPVPQCLGTLHPQYDSPWVCTVAFSCLLFLLVGVEFTDLIAASMFFDCFSFVVQFAAWVRHRAASRAGYARVDDASVYRAPVGLAGVIVISAFPVALCVAAVSLTFRDQGSSGLAGFGGTLVVSTVMYSLQRARGG